ncbi:F-box protein cpr1 [Thalictrum thalictroides]|uniref:F-box protein cpr1 n=1 Tax=Thalictrum thalictroides TaxID=46969 RepID=A0A7J6X610_THATH|nr:F-box protein cpr1 [Thalictrum thalictroides]
MSIMVLCNPTTKECVEVPLNIEQVPAGYNRLFDSNFGYDPVTDTYKVLRIDIYYSTTDLGYTEVYVYTLGNKVWRKIQTIFRPMNWYNASYVHGAFHWFKLADKSTWNDKPPHLDSSSIISFDVGSEEFRTVPWIKMAKSGDTANTVVLGVIQECLSVSHQYNKEGCIDIWLMKDYGVKESWTKVFSLSLKGGLFNCAPMIVLENGELIIRHGENGKLLDEKGNLYAYNIQRQTISKAIPIGVWRTAFIFVESLVSISSIGTQEDVDMG